MKKYFISFTYIEASEEGEQSKLTYEMVDVHGDDLLNLPAKKLKFMIAGELQLLGYERVNILHMNAL